MKKLLLTCYCIITTLISMHAQLIPGDVNKPVNQVYTLGAANYGSAGAPTYTVTPPTTCAGTGSLTVSWPAGATISSIRGFAMHNAMNNSGILIYPCSPAPCPPGALVLNNGNGFTQTFTGLAAGLYTFGVHRDNVDDDITTNNAGAGNGDDVSISGGLSMFSDQNRAGVVGLNLMPVNANNLTTCTITHTNATNCITNNGSVTISGLRINTQYDYATLVDGIFSGSNFSGATGTITISNLLTGIYPIKIRVNGQTCTRQFNIKVGNNSGIECFADNQLLDASLGTNLITGGDFGVGTASLPVNGTTDYTSVVWATYAPGDSQYTLEDTTDNVANGIVITNQYDYRLRNMTYTTQSRHLFACLQLTGDHTGSLNQGNGNTGINQGFMMVVNANYRNDRALNVSGISLTQGRNYIFSFWGKNLQPFMPKNKNNGTLTQTYQPIIPRLALAVNGIIYDFADMGVTLEPASYTASTILNQMGWEFYNLRFVAPVSNANSNVTIYNFQQGGFGNDFAIDDVQFLSISVIGDRVWNDLNRDGLQDLNEPGMANVTVTLTDVNDKALQTTVSDAFGYYQFANLAAGTYKVKFSQPAGYVFSPQNVPGTPLSPIDSDPNTTTGITPNIIIVANGSELSVDCGLVFDQPLLPASISDLVWYDANSNGIQDNNENGLANVTVVLYNAAGTTVLATTVTNASGTNIRKSDVITLTANQQITNMDIGLVIMNINVSSFGDYCWIDLDQNGIQNANEPGMAGVTVTLYSPGPNNIIGGGDDVVLDAMETDAFGKWQFTNLNLNKYFVTFSLPSGYSFTAQNVGSDETIDSDVTTGGFSNIIDVANSSDGFNYEVLDVGYFLTTPPPNFGSIGNFFWNDINGDGIQQATEFGVPGITVQLLRASDSAVLNTTTTDLNGFYVFTYLAPANYLVRFTNIPPAFQITLRDQGGNDALDSDIDQPTGISHIITVAANQQITNVDGAIRQVLFTGNSTVGSYVWYDFNNNGIQDIDETGVPDITVTLQGTGADGIFGTFDDFSSTQVTNALGQFMFNALNQGRYRVVFGNVANILPTYLTLSPKDVSSNTMDNSDSDGNTISAGISITDAFRLLFGEDKVNIGLGLVPISTVTRIGNRVWKDENGNGLQDGAETKGVQSVVVQLMNTSGTVIDKDLITAGTQPWQTVSNIQGYWNILNVPNATYIPRFSFLPPGFRVTNSKVGSNNAIDSDVLLNGRSIQTANVTVLTPVVLDIDLGLVPFSSTVGDYVWDDLNGDGLQNTTEPGIIGTTATIYNSANVALGSAITDSAGKYYFPNVPSGNYYFRFANYPVGMQYTVQESNNYATNGSNVSMLTQQTNTYTFTTFGDSLHFDAGLRVLNTANVGDYVWMDANGNGRQDAGERALAGIVVTLFNAGPNGIVENGAGDDFALGATVTDGNGYYQFIITPTGNNYYLRFTNTPPTSAFTTKDNGSGTNDSRVFPATGQTPAFNLTYGASNQNQDAGIINVRVLALDQVQFNASKASNGVLLTCTTLNAMNVATYEILYSKDGVTFNTLSQVTNNAAGALSYIHTNPIKGINYYRIIIHDLTGQKYVTEVRTITYTDITSGNIYPNPVDNKIFFAALCNSTNVTNYTITNINGKSVQANTIKPTQLANGIPVTNLSSGVYLITLYNQAEVILRQSFIKK